MRKRNKIGPTGNSVADYEVYIEECETCNGYGNVPDDNDTHIWVTCLDCDGKGEVEVRR